LKGLRLWLARNNGALFAFVLFVAMFSVYVVKNGVGLKIGLVTAVANKGVLLALVAIAACIVPARMAARVSPQEALRGD